MRRAGYPALFVGWLVIVRLFFSFFIFFFFSWSRAYAWDPGLSYVTTQCWDRADWGVESYAECEAAAAAWVHEQDFPAYSYMANPQSYCANNKKCSTWYGFRVTSDEFDCSSCESGNCNNLVYEQFCGGPPCDEELSLEGGGTSCGVCPSGFIRGKEGSPFDCMMPREPRECEFLGKVEIITDQGAYCVDECTGPVIDGICLDPEEQDPDEPECSIDHPDYVGSIGYGHEARLICGDPNNKCADGETFGFVSNGTTLTGGCFPNEYNPPQCSGSDVLVVDQWGGHSCLPLKYANGTGNSGDSGNTSNGDSDGDGQGDLTGIAGQLQDIKSLLTDGNTNTNNINETLKGISNQIGDGIGKLTEAIGNIPGGGGGGSGGKTQIVGEDGSAISWSGSPIDLGLEDIQEEYDGVMQEYQQKIQQIKSEVQGMFGASLSAGGSVDDDVHTIKGVDVNFSINRFLGGLNILGGIVLFVAAFISAGILFTGRG